MRGVVISVNKVTAPMWTYSARPQDQIIMYVVQSYLSADGGQMEKSGYRSIILVLRMDSPK